MEKQCSKCNVVKSINEFNKRANTIDGTQYNCRDCQNKSSLEWRQNNPDYVKKWRQNNPDYVKKYNLEWRQNNPDYVKKYILEWRQNNPEYHNQYQKERIANDHNFRLAHNLRNRLRKALLRKITSKNDTTEALLGISYSEFKNLLNF